MIALNWKSGTVAPLRGSPTLRVAPHPEVMAGLRPDGLTRRGQAAPSLLDRLRQHQAPRLL